MGLGVVAGPLGLFAYVTDGVDALVRLQATPSEVLDRSIIGNPDEATMREAHFRADGITL